MAMRIAAEEALEIWMEANPSLRLKRTLFLKPAHSRLPVWLAAATVAPVWTASTQPAPRAP